MPRPAPQPSGGNPMLYVVLGGMAVALAGAGGYIYWKNQQEANTPATTLAAAPTPVPTATPETPTTTLAPPPTAAPPPTFDEAQGKAAASLRAAQSAFKDFNYDKMMAAAQKALQEDPGNKNATRLVENALQGQKAESHIKAAENALAKGDFAAASAEADQAHGLAPWDTRATGLVGRIQGAQQQAQSEKQQKDDKAQRDKAQQAQAQVTTYISKATDQLAARNYDAAIALYDEALKLDPGNATATQGRIGAITAKSVAEAGSRGGGTAGGKTFVVGKTATTSPELRAGAQADGFDDSAGVVVKKGTQAADLPGVIAFEVRPEAPKGGDKYTVYCYLVNQGNQPIAIKEMIVTPRINGRGGAVPMQPLVASAAPHDRAKLLESSETWREETTSWSFEVVVRTPRGESYKNSVVWK